MVSIRRLYVEHKEVIWDQNLISETEHKEVIW